MPLPTVQPPEAEAPTPIRMPPKTERTAWVADGRRRRNSPEALAAKEEPNSKPRTSSAPQYTVYSPLMRNLERLEDGLVMPRPSLRPVAADSGQAITPSTPMMAAVG